jgi:carbon-monoxide dehydrogenase large subunit
MDRALALAEWNGFESRRNAARARGKLRGIGLASVIEIAAGPLPGQWKNSSKFVSIPLAM